MATVISLWGRPYERQEANLGDFPFAALTASAKPVLYISLGTIANKRLDFYRNCLAAFQASPEWQVVMSVGRQIDIAQLGEIPANFIVRPSVPPIKLLDYVSVFMTHGGMNSAMEALYHGIPLILLPQMGEQEVNARRVAELGAGIVLKNSTRSSIAELKQAVATVSRTPHYREKAAALSQVVQASGGYQQAVAEILRFKEQYVTDAQAPAKREARDAGA